MLGRLDSFWNLLIEEIGFIQPNSHRQPLYYLRIYLDNIMACIIVALKKLFKKWKNGYEKCRAGVLMSC